MRASAPADVNNGPPSQKDPAWGKYTIGKDAFDLKQGFGWFQATLDDLPAGSSKLQLKFRSVDENATVFINDIKLLKHDGWNKPFTVNIDHVDTLKKPLILTVFIENYSNEGGIDREVHAIDLSTAMKLTGWHMRGGPGELSAADTLKMLAENSPHEGPCFFVSSFELPATHSQSCPVYRVTTKGLGHGSVWVNGHNLGRYPEKTPVNGLYIPECWMVKGKNIICIYGRGRKASVFG